MVMVARKQPETSSSFPDGVVELDDLGADYLEELLRVSSELEYTTGEIDQVLLQDRPFDSLPSRQVGQLTAFAQGWNN
ncbi:hypothetical protein EJB05_28393, partial [Eragrostis curvula]